jgi:beta-glucanase (GH16 family)
MSQRTEPPTGAISARVSVPDKMVYTGQLPAQVPGLEKPATPESAWRNLALTLAVVLVMAAAAAVIFWPKSAAPSVAWITPTGGAASTTPSAAEALYQGPPASGMAMPTGDLPGWKQTFTEDFNGEDLSRNWWIYNGQPSGDPGGWFSASHISQSGGRLVIGGSRANTPNGNIYATGGISNGKSFSQTYGKFDIRFRMDAGYGVNFVVLLWPTNDDWPPEINIAEDNGLTKRTSFSSTLHFGGHGGDVTHLTRNKSGVDFTQWHTVGIEWTPGKLVMYLDGTKWANIDSTGVPKTPMSLALQSQAWMCGGYFSDCPNATTPANVNMEVDWAVAYTKV